MQCVIPPRLRGKAEQTQLMVECATPTAAVVSLAVMLPEGAAAQAALRRYPWDERLVLPAAGVFVALSDQHSAVSDQPECECCIAAKSVTADR
jgi:hypothetical protein